MVDPLLHVTKRHPDSVLQDTVVMEIKLEDLKTIFQRALNTWADAPPYLFVLSDKLEKL